MQQTTIPHTLSTPILDPNDSFLFQHYVNNLAVAPMSPILESDLFTPLNADILHHALSVPYVYHVVLSFSALHLASVYAFYASHSPDPSHAHNHYHFLSTALAHKDAALQEFLPAIGAGIEASIETLLATSAVLVACELALPAADPVRRTAFDRIDILAQVAGLFQGTNHIFLHHTVPPYVAAATLGSPCGPDTSSSGAAPPSLADDVSWEEGLESIHRIIDTLESLEPSEDAAEENRLFVLTHAATKLYKAFSAISSGERDFRALCNWLGMVKKEFVNLIHSRDPMSLLLLAHWSICRIKMDSVWWARGWPESAVVSINEALDENHRPLLEWCLSQAHKKMEAIGYQPL